MIPIFLQALLLYLVLSVEICFKVLGVGVGINYGQIANNLPTPSRVAVLLSSLNVNKVKLYDADPNVLNAFAGTNVDFVIGLGNEYLQRMTDRSQAQSWIQQHVQPYISRTKITCITVGNELLTATDYQAISNLLPAMKTVYSALQNLGLSDNVYVSTAHSTGILANSFPPSSSSFKEELAEYIQPLLRFHAQTKSPFLINCYPFFAYKDNPETVSLEYVLFQNNPGVIDPVTGLKYDNMLYAQIDAVYSAIKAMGHTDIQVKVSETGWPSKGDTNEVGATPENAGLYNSNLLKRIQQNEGTPAKPSIPVDIYVFALFNENLKPGPVSERNYGLYYPNGTPVYDFGLQGYLRRMQYSGSTKDVSFSLTYTDASVNVSIYIPLYLDHVSTLLGTRVFHQDFTHLKSYFISSTVILSCTWSGYNYGLSSDLVSGFLCTTLKMHGKVLKDGKEWDTNLVLLLLK